MKALFKSVNLIGDALYIGPALRAWIKQTSGVKDIWMWTLDDHITPLYEGMVRDLVIGENTFGTCFVRPDVKFDFEHTFDVNAAFKLSDAKKQHLATSYADLLGVKIGDNMKDLKPIYIPNENNDDCMNSQTWEQLEELEGCILVSMFSASCTGRDPKYNYVPNKMLPWDKWVPMVKFLREHFPSTPICCLGAPTDILSDIFARQETYGVEAMFGIPLNRLALIMQKAKLLVTIDNGMAHLGASQEVPTFEMYPKALGAHYILPLGNPNLVWVHMNPVTVDKEYLLNGLQYAISKFEKTIWRKK